MNPTNSSSPWGKCPQCGSTLTAPTRLGLSERTLWCPTCQTSRSISIVTGEESWVLARTDSPDLVHSWSWTPKAGAEPSETVPEVIWTRKIEEAAKLPHSRAVIIHAALWDAGVMVEMMREAELAVR